MNTQEKPLDRRVVKTRRAIRNAFAQLLAEKDINDISITDIANRADINRKTFYKHYKGLYQLVDEIQNELIDSLQDLFEGLEFRAVMKHPYVLFERLHAVVEKDFDFYSQLMRVDSAADLNSKMVVAVQKRVKEMMKQQLDVEDETLEIVSRFMVAGMLGAYQSWFNSDQTVPLEIVSEQVGRLCFFGINGLLTAEDGR